jgi:hypothetical protein
MSCNTVISHLSHHYDVGSYYLSSYFDVWKISRPQDIVWHFKVFYDSPDVSIHFRYPTGIVIMRECSMSSLKQTCGLHSCKIKTAIIECIITIQQDSCVREVTGPTSTPLPFNYPCRQQNVQCQVTLCNPLVHPLVQLTFILFCCASLSHLASKLPKICPFGKLFPGPFSPSPYLVRRRLLWAGQH